MSTHNIGFYEEISKISLNYHQISSNTYLISSAEVGYRCRAITFRLSPQCMGSTWIWIFIPSDVFCKRLELGYNHECVQGGAYTRALKSQKPRYFTNDWCITL